MRLRRQVGIWFCRFFGREENFVFILKIMERNIQSEGQGRVGSVIEIYLRFEFIILVVLQSRLEEDEFLQGNFKVVVVVLVEILVVWIWLVVSRYIEEKDVRNVQEVKLKGFDVNIE